MSYKNNPDHGIAEYYNWMQVPEATISTITESSENFTTSARYAQLVYLVNAGGGSGSIDTTLLSSMDQNLAEINVDTTNINIDTGNLVDSLSSVISTVDSAVSTNDVVIVGGKAETTTPTAVSDGDAVNIWYDEYGRQVIKSYEPAINALRQTEIAPTALMTIEDTLLNAVTANGSSASINVLNYNLLTFYVTSTGVTTGANVDIEVSYDNSNWVTKETVAVISNTTNTVNLNNEINKYVRATVSSYTDGTYTVYIIGGRN